MRLHLRGSGFCVMTTRDSWLLGLNQGICGGCWHIQYRFLTRNLSCFIKTNSLDSFSLCSNVFRVCHPDGLGMIGFFLSQVFHPLEKNIVWKLLSCLAVEVIQQSHSFCPWHSMRLGAVTQHEAGCPPSRAGWTVPGKSSVLFLYKSHSHLHVPYLLSQPAGNTSRPRKGMDERVEQTGMGKTALWMCYQEPLPGGVILASWSVPALK